MRRAQPPELHGLAQLGSEHGEVRERLPRADAADQLRGGRRSRAPRRCHLGDAAPVREAAAAVEGEGPLARALGGAQHGRRLTPQVEELRERARPPVAQSETRLAQPHLLVVEQARPRGEGRAPRSLARAAGKRRGDARHGKPLAERHERGEQTRAAAMPHGARGAGERAHDRGARARPRREAGAQRERAGAREPLAGRGAQHGEAGAVVAPHEEKLTRHGVAAKGVHGVGARLRRPHAKGAPRGLERRVQHRLHRTGRAAVAVEHAEAAAHGAARGVEVGRPEGRAKPFPDLHVEVPRAQQPPGDVPPQCEHDGADAPLLAQ